MANDQDTLAPHRPRTDPGIEAVRARAKILEVLLLAIGLLLYSPKRAHAQDAGAATPACACACADSAEPRTSSGPLDLNRASEDALVALPGIGPARARAIVAYRAEQRGFRSVTQLLHIRGIGRALLKQLRPLVTVGPRDAPAG